MASSSNKRFIVIANYSQKAIAGLVQAPSEAAVRKLCKSVGAKFVSMEVCRGAFDIVAVVEADSYDRALGLKAAVVASGTVSELHLLEAIDMTEALKHAGAAAKGYVPPG